MTTVLPGAELSAARTELLQGFRRQQTRQWLLIAGGLVLLGMGIVTSASLGDKSMAPGDTIRVIFAPLLPRDWYSGIEPVQVAILQRLRLPRIAMAIIGGAGLSIAGVAMQGITRNPMVSPFTIGISPAAAFGASLVMLSGLNTAPGLGRYWMVLGAFVSALICAALVLGFAAMRGISSTMLILGGVGLTYLFSALTATVQFFATDQLLASIVQWTFGSLNGIVWSEVGIVGAVLLGVMPVLAGHAWALNAFAAGGDEVAASLGFAIRRTRTVITVAAVLITAAIVSFTGVIGFVGLVAPHIARLLIGGDHRPLLPFAAIVGALLLLIADMAGRLVLAPVIIPVGIVVSYLGVPLFLHLLLSRKGEIPG